MGVHSVGMIFSKTLFLKERYCRTFRQYRSFIQYEVDTQGFLIFYNSILPYEDKDSDGTFLIQGGTVLALGSSGMLELPDSASQQVFIAAVGDGFFAGSTVTVEDEQGNELIACTAAKRFSAVIYSSPDMTADQEYRVLVDGELLRAYTGAGGMGDMAPGGGMNRPGGGMGGRPGF